MTSAEVVIGKSASAFLGIVWPVVRGKIGGGELMPVEGHASDAMKKSLDVLAGIDAWQMLGNRQGMRGIASRVQPSGKNWGTFTIRYKLASGADTEFQKRRHAIESAEGLLFPHLTIQAYLSEGYAAPVHGVGIIRTHDLIIAAMDYDWPVRTCGQDGNQFMFLSWAKLRGIGCDVITIPEDMD